MIGDEKIPFVMPKREPPWRLKGAEELGNTARPWNHHVFFVFRLEGDERPKPRPGVNETCETNGDLVTLVRVTETNGDL
jgi:hypothetical protein